jgi:hypothetical protein
LSHVVCVKCSVEAGGLGGRPLTIAVPGWLGPGRRAMTSDSSGTNAMWDPRSCAGWFIAGSARCTTCCGRAWIASMTARSGSRDPRERLTALETMPRY